MDAPPAGEEQSDEALMERVAGGDRPAFARLSRRHLDRTVWIAERIAGSRADAEDVAQEVFLKVWLQAGRWQPGGASFRTWLYRVTVNQAIDHARRRGRRPATEPLDEAAEDVAAESGEAPLAMLERDETTRAVSAAVADLAPRQRAAIALCYAGELSNGEAAAALKISVGALESLLVRARRALRQRLEHLMD